MCVCHLETRFLTHARRRSLPPPFLPAGIRATSGGRLSSDDDLIQLRSIKEDWLVAWCRVAAWVISVYVMEWVTYNGGLSKSTGSHRPSGTWRCIVWHIPYFSDEPVSFCRMSNSLPTWRCSSEFLRNICSRLSTKFHGVTSLTHSALITSDITRSIHLSLRCPACKWKCSAVAYSECLKMPDNLTKLFSWLDTVIIATCKTK